MEKSKIGRKVWATNDNGIILNKENPALIVGIKPAKSVNDFCDHVVLRLNGKLFEEREYRCIFILEETDDASSDINNYLGANGMYADDVYINSEGSARVEISWGDWKHEHMWCDILMRHIGYKSDGEEVTDEDGSDCYSAIHFYSKVA